MSGQCHDGAWIVSGHEVHLHNSSLYLRTKIEMRTKIQLRQISLFLRQ